MPGTPKLACEDLIDQLNRLNGRERRNDFVLRGFEKRARDLLKVDAEKAYDALGAISALRGDIQSMRENHLNAIRLNQHDFRPHHNFSVSLSKTGFFMEATEQAAIAFESNPGTSWVGRNYLELLIQAGLFEQAHRVCLRLEKLTSEDEPDRVRISRMLGIMKDRGIREDALSALMNDVTRVLDESRIHLLEVRSRFLADEDSETLLCKVLVDAPLSKVRQLNDRLVDLLVDSDEESLALSIFCPRFSALESVDADTTAAIA